MGALRAVESTERWAIVTGASSGLGTEFANQLAARGYDVVLVARRLERLQTVAKDIEAKGRRAIAIESDLTAPGAVQALLRELEARNVAADLLVNNAGVGLYGAALDHTVDQVGAMLRLNVLALTELALALGRQMAARGSGAIINVSSTAGFQPQPWFATYSASKAYVTSFSLALAHELAPKGVRVLTHCPGPTRTEFNRVAAVHAARDTDWVYMSAEKCVALALRALDRRRRLVVPGFLNAIAAFLARRSPLGLLTRVTAWLFLPSREKGS
jgi:short-subunit dehydrogenase